MGLPNYETIRIPPRDAPVVQQPIPDLQCDMLFGVLPGAVAVPQLAINAEGIDLVTPEATPEAEGADS